MSFNHILTETDNENIDFESQSEHQLQIQEIEESGGILGNFNSMKVKFYKTGELNGSNHVKIPLNSSTLVNIKHDDIYIYI